jgi:hypothetical protein
MPLGHTSLLRAMAAAETSTIRDVGLPMSIGAFKVFLRNGNSLF